MLLSTPAGIVDLRLGRLMGSRREAMLTQLTGASPGTRCPRWLAFLAEITGSDDELVAYLARLFGYAASGDTSEQVFAFFYGHGSNGKSLLLQTISAVMGTYAATAPFETFAGTRLDRHPTDLAGLRGARLVTVTETERGRSWSETRIKTVTGGDPIRVRFIGRDFFEFRPAFKLIVAGNHRPAFHGVGEAMRRRLHVVPFGVTFTEAQCDRTLPERLLAERDGILGWIIEGCLAWQRLGLNPPRAVRSAADEYFADEDLTGQWIAESCRVGPAEKATARDLFESWSAWARDNGIEPGSQKTLGEALRSRGLVPGKVGTSRGWIGISSRRPS